MSNAHLDAETIAAIEKLPIDRRQIVARALGVVYNNPTPEEQIEGKGMVSLYKRTNSHTSNKTVELPKVMTADGKTVPAVHLEASYARAYAKEILRVCDAEGL